MFWQKHCIVARSLVNLCQITVLKVKYLGVQMPNVEKKVYQNWFFLIKITSQFTNTFYYTICIRIWVPNKTC